MGLELSSNLTSDVSSDYTIPHFNSTADSATWLVKNPTVYH